jgi:hypothetical protein
MVTPERQLEEALVTKLRDLKYEYRPDIRDRAALELNFREKFEALIRLSWMCTEPIRNGSHGRTARKLRSKR